MMRAPRCAHICIKHTSLFSSSSFHHCCSQGACLMCAPSSRGNTSTIRGLTSLLLLLPGLVLPLSFFAPASSLFWSHTSSSKHLLSELNTIGLKRLEKRRPTSMTCNCSVARKLEDDPLMKRTARNFNQARASGGNEFNRFRLFIICTKTWKYRKGFTS